MIVIERHRDGHCRMAVMSYCIRMTPVDSRAAHGCLSWMKKGGHGALVGFLVMTFVAGFAGCLLTCDTDQEDGAVTGGMTLDEVSHGFGGAIDSPDPGCDTTPPPLGFARLISRDYPIDLPLLAPSIFQPPRT